MEANAPRVAPPLTATYRLQLSGAFTLDDARERVPYLHRLGISHLYLSPILAARTGSTHGYDVADPAQISAALGGASAFAALAETVHQRGMGIVLDIVPNHMGVGPDNPYWDDLLMHGQASRYAGWFDVSWRAPSRSSRGRVLLPVLGDTLANVLARDELKLEVRDDVIRVVYHEHHFPIDPATMPPELEVALRDPAARGVLPDWTTGTRGRARLRELLARQHYELAFWRAAQRDINYRRFFDVNELICLRVEREDVFDSTHHIILQLVADGLVDGLRVDHVDGLLEPRRYLERLRAAVDARRPAARGAARVPIFVEKILGAGETLPPEWPVDGTTGYEFLTALEDVFIDPAGYATLERAYERRRDSDFHGVARDGKRRVLRSALNADVRRIAPMLASLARDAGLGDYSIAAHAGAIVELIVELPVYRTYIDAGRPEPSPSDRAVLAGAFERASATGRADASALAALEQVMLGAWHDAPRAVAASRLAFVLRWQQLTGPAAAKGVEDTALYAWAPLASRNEVGGDPGVPVIGAVARLHERLTERAARFPRSLNATNTHDTKRSADVRSRLDALSEHAAEWERLLASWRRRHRAFQRRVSGQLAPSRMTDNFIYQSLVGIWPRDRGADADVDTVPLDEVRERMTAYIQKAVREAKTSTSWTDPDVDYERAIAEFIARLLDPAQSREFLREVDGLVQRIAVEEEHNQLARLVVHLTAPGVPDLYQGDELWFAALVDPDNRRPVDWEARAAALERRDDPNGWSKITMIRKLLRWRRDAVPMMTEARYESIAASGELAEQLFAYRVGEGSDAAVVVVPRLTRRLGSIAADGAIGAVWGSTSLPLGTMVRWRCVLTGRDVDVAGGAVMVADLLATLPVAVLTPA